MERHDMIQVSERARAALHKLLSEDRSQRKAARLLIDDYS
jgi:hypothetical protein